MAINQKLYENFLSLPQDLQEVIFAERSAESIQTISEKYQLPLDKMGMLAILTGRVLLGVLPPNRYISEIAKNLEVDRQTAVSIAQEINQEIFYPVRDSLRKLYSMIPEEELGLPKPEIPSAPPPQKPGEFEMKMLEKEMAKEKPEEALLPRRYGLPPLVPIKEELPPAPPSPPAGLPAFEPEKPTPPTGEDKYREEPPLEETKTPFEKMGGSSQNPNPKGPRIEGNIIDLKNLDLE